MAIVSMLYGAGGASSAEDVSYDNTTSGLEADNVQDAIDEVNSNLGEYTTSEKVVGKWINGEPIYQITIYSTTTVPRGNTSPTHPNFTISGKQIISVEAVAYDEYNNYTPLPFASPNNVIYNISVGISSAGISIQTGSSVSVLKHSITIKYIKTS